MIFNKATWYFVSRFITKLLFFVWNMIDLFSDVSVLQGLFAVWNHLIGITPLLLCNLKDSWKCFFFSKVLDING